ncbi:PWWP domain [Musa troglodytarum]|uniref:PWWP domain n=1 Tax=Musa troglodytarum TaxID=320322 RepID=A0A9E7G2C0_9LILI|nr:PWWP domain [Musa troglodytarum]
MASRLAAEQTGGLDLNAGGQEGESTDAAAEPASDPGGDGRGKCLADSDGGVSSPREAGDASCGGQNATMDVAADDDGVAAANEVTEAGAEVVGCGGAADVRGDLEIWVEKQNDVEDEVGSRSSVDGCQGDHKLECAAVEAGSTVVAAVETALTEEVATVPGRIEPVEFEKTRNEDETVEKFDSSVKKPYLEIDMMAGGNFGEGETATTEDEETQSSLVAANGSGGRKAQMDVMEIDSVIGAARTTNAVHLDEVTVDRSHFLQDEAVVGEKDNHVENENRTELVEDDLSQKEKEESVVKGAVDCDSIDEHLQDKLDVLDLSSSEMEVGSSCTHKLEVSMVNAECTVESVPTLTTAAMDRNDVDRSVDTSDGNDVVMSVDTSDPGAIQVGVSEISNQTEVKENQLSYQNGNKIVDGQLQPEVSASGSIVSELEKNSLDEEKLKAGFANPAYLSGCDSSMNVVGLEAGKPDGVADLGDIEVGVVESDRKELAGEGISSIETASQVITHDLVDTHLEPTEVDRGANALDARCATGAAESDSLVTLVSVEAESSGGTRDQKRTQVDAMEIGIGNELPGHGLSIVKENQNLTIEAVDHPEVDKHLHESEGDLRPGDTDQNEELIVESSFVVDETEDILTVAINRYNESKELDREPEASRLSLLDNDGGRASFSEMPFASISQNIQDEENAIHEKELQKVDPLLVDRSKTNKISDDKRDSDLTDPKEVNVLGKNPLGAYLLDVDDLVSTGPDTAANVQVVKTDSGDIHLLYDNQETESQTFMEDVNLSVEISMPRTSESSQIENVPSGIESAHVVVTKSQETEPQTVSSLATSNHFTNDIGENCYPGSLQNMVTEYNACKEDESPTTEFCQNVETGRNLEADQEFVLGGSILNVSPDAGTHDNERMVVDEQETSKGTDKQAVEHAATSSNISVENSVEHPCCYLPSKDEDGFCTSDLVWGKVKSHPWWPGQIFDPSDASDLALRHQKKDNFLMEKQSNSDVFVDAIDGALDEVARRMGLGMTCSCFPEAANATYSDQKVENAGIHEDSNGYNVDRSAILSYFQPGRLLEYVKALAKFPDCGTDRLELVMVNAQLKAFFRSKGYPELPSFKFISGLSENDAEISCSRSEGIMEVTIEQSGPIVSEMMFGKLKSRGRWSSMQKNVLEDGKKQKNLSELMEVECSQLANGANTEFGIKVDESDSLYFNKKRKATDSDSSDSEKGKKKRLDSLGDLQNKLPPLAVSSSFKIGECIRRVASQLTGAPPILKGHSEASLKNVSKDDSIFDVFISDGFSDVNMQSPRDKKENWEDYSSDEMLSQLCSAAMDPAKGHDCLSVIISFFTEVRDYCVSTSYSEKKHPEKTGGRRGRKRKVDNQLAVLEMTELDHMQDSYWSDLISHNGPAKSKGEAQTRSQRKKRKSSGQTSSTLVLVPVLQGAEHIQVGKISPIIRQAAPIDRPIISVEEKMVDEFMPTALVLNFNGSSSLPSETDLIRIFSRYGPLKEAATEVQQKNNRVVVVFKRRADAEIAFSNAGKYSIFGPSLLSYRLRYFPSTPDAFPDSKQLDKTDALLVENSNLNTPANVHSSMSVASPDTDTNPQDKSDAVPTENSSANDPSDLHPSISDAYTDTNLLDKNGAAVLEYSDHPLMSDGSPDTNLHEKSDAVPTENSSANNPSNLHPSVSDAYPDTNLLDKNDAAVFEHSNITLPSNIHPLMSDGSPGTNLQEKSDAVLTEDSSANNPSDFHPSVSDAYLDANLLDKNDAAVLEHSNISLPCDLHPLVSDGSSDANLQDTSDANVQDTSDAMPTENSSTNNPSYLHPPMPYLDTNLRDKNDAAVLEHSNTSLPSDLHPPMSDGSLTSTSKTTEM